MAGFIDAYVYAGNETALEAAEILVTGFTIDSVLVHLSS
jgi:hypothetical protein